MTLEAFDVTISIAGIEIDGQTFKSLSEREPREALPLRGSATYEATVTIESKQWRRMKRAVSRQLNGQTRIPLGRLGGRSAFAWPRMGKFARKVWNAIGRPR